MRFAITKNEIDNIFENKLSKGDALTEQENAILWEYLRITQSCVADIETKVRQEALNKQGEDFEKQVKEQARVEGWRIDEEIIKQSVVDFEKTIRDQYEKEQLAKYCAEQDYLYGKRG